MMKILLYKEKLKENGILCLLKKRFNKDLISVFTVKRKMQKDWDHKRFQFVCQLWSIGSDFLELIEIYWLHSGFQRKIYWSSSSVLPDALEKGQVVSCSTCSILGLTVYFVAVEDKVKVGGWQISFWYKEEDC